MIRAVGLVLAAVVVSGCSEPLEFADWTIPVPQGTRIIEYGVVSMDDRVGKTIGLERDLVIGGGDSPETSFYQPADLAVDHLGRIWVLDARKYQVQVFDADGSFLFAVGQRGEGPGELQSPQEVAIANDRLFVITNHRMSVWGLDGDYLDTFTFGPVNQLYSVDGSPAGDLLFWHRVFGESLLTSRGRVTRVGSDGTEVGSTFDVPETSAPTIVVDGEERRPSRTLGWWIPRVDVARTGATYVTGSDEYQIVRIDPSGVTSWALRVPWPRAEITEEQVDSAFEELRRKRPAATPDHVYSWGRQPAIAGIAVDGHENVWVFPWIQDPLQKNERPVDVYSKDGQRVFAGMVPVRRQINIVGEYVEDLRWRDSLGDHIYSFGVDPQSEEHLVVRYRLGHFNNGAS